MSIIKNINKVLDHRIRLAVMSVLIVNQKVSFNHLKELLEITDGNLANHIKTLEKAEYLSIEKSFINRKPNTNYRATNSGRNAFKTHINALEILIKNGNN